MNKKSLILILIVIAWMGLIFKFSSESGEISANKSSSILSIIQKTSGNVLSNKEKKIGFGYTISVRKTAHVISYFILSVLIFASSYFILKSNKKAYLVAIMLSLIYAISDEVHQIFIPGRTATIRDVFIDMFGVALGMLIIMIYKKVYTKKIN